MLPDGGQSLLLVSDDNFEDSQRTVRSKPFYDISVSKRCALLGPFSCALRACSDARDHNTTIFSSPKGEGFRPSPEETLRKKPGVVKKLSTYHENVQKIPLMGVEVVPLDLKILWRASELRFEFGLMMDGSLMASTALEAGLEVMATADKDFQSVRELSVAMPGDLRKRP